MINKNKFLEEYRLQEVFLAARSKGLTWKRLTAIYDDYNKVYYTYCEQRAHEIVDKLYKKAPSEATIIYGRAKNHRIYLKKLLEKSGRKTRQII